MIIILFAVIVFIMAVGFCAAEAIYERDWPRDMGKFAFFALLILLFSISAFGQNSRYDNQATTANGSGQQLPVLALPYASISFYSCSGGCTGTLASTYNSASSVSACPTGSQVVLQGSSACTSLADAQGNFGAWFQPGQYCYTITPQYGGTSQCYTFTVGTNTSSGSVSSVGLASNVTGTSVSGSPVTSSGTLTLNQSAPWTILQGGTNASTAAAAIVNLTPVCSSGNYLTNNGTNVVCTNPTATLHYQTIASQGTAVTQRPVLDFDSTVTVTDSSSPAETIISVAPVADVIGQYVDPVITINGHGIISAVVGGQAIDCSGSSCWRQDGDGTLSEWGIATGTQNGSHTDIGAVTITFPEAFTDAGSIVVTANSQWCDNDATCGYGHHPISVTMNGTPTINGTTGYLDSNGSTTPASVPVVWFATGK
jgi:hypothetical protein